MRLMILRAVRKFDKTRGNRIFNLAGLSSALKEELDIKHVIDGNTLIKDLKVRNDVEPDNETKSHWRLIK
jgi:hypothetical protein